MSFYRSLPKLKITPIKNCGSYEDEVDINIPDAFDGRVKKTPYDHTTDTRPIIHRFNPDGSCPFEGCKWSKNFDKKGRPRKPVGNNTASMHYNTHIKTFTCDECGKVCNAKSTLQGHMKRKHGKQLWFCNDDGCDYFATISSHLITHIARIHHSNVYLNETCPCCAQEWSSFNTDKISHYEQCSGLRKTVRSNEAFHMFPLKA